MAVPDGYVPEGRLGNPDILLVNDPRVHPKLAALLKAYGMDKREEDPPLTIESPLEQIRALCAHFEGAMTTLYDNAPTDLPGDEHEPEIKQRTITVKGVDGNDILLYVFRRADTEGQTLPALVYTHGGGMTIMKTANRLHFRFLKSLALGGVVAIGVDFRNAYTEEGHNPFPAGLNDCGSALQHIASHRAELGISKIVLTGESGGGNLAIATTLLAKRDGYLKEIAGVYAIIPTISGGSGWSKERQIKELPSLYAHDGYFLGLKLMELLGHYYTPTEEGKVNPLAWPLNATEKDLEGLPPFYLHMDELDPLRDDGKAFYRKLIGAGVPAAAHVTLGTAHGSGLMFRQIFPEICLAIIDSIIAFAKRV